MSTSLLRPVMDDEHYEQERKQLEETYGHVDAKTVEVVARRDQAFALFYYHSGWSQERLAAREGKTQQWVAYRLRFGRFIAFAANTTMVVNGENAVLSAVNLTERRFRDYWEQGDKNERNENIRFRAVVRLMAEDIRFRRSQVSRAVGIAVMEHFADGEWHKFDTMREKIGCTPEDLQGVLINMKAHGTHKSVLETKPYGTSCQYRIMRRERMISSHELTTKLAPLIKALLVEGRKHTAQMSAPTVVHLASQLQQHLEEWCK